MKMQTAATSAATGPIPEILVVAKSMVNMLQVSVTKMPRPAGTSRLGLLLPRRWSLPLAVTSDCCYRGSVKAKGRQWLATAKGKYAEGKKSLRQWHDKESERDVDAGAAEHWQNCQGSQNEGSVCQAHSQGRKTRDVSRFSPQFDRISFREAPSPIFVDLNAGVSEFLAQKIILIFDDEQVHLNLQVSNSCQDQESYNKT